MTSKGVGTDVGTAVGGDDGKLDGVDVGDPV